MVMDHAALGVAYLRLFRPRQHTGLTKPPRRSHRQNHKGGVDEKDHKGTISEEEGRNTSDDVSQELSRIRGDLTTIWSLVFLLPKQGRLESVWSLIKSEIENGERSTGTVYTIY